MASSSSLRKICSNTNCGKVMGVPRKGWRCQGGHVDLCDKCFVSFDLGQFCYIYHKISTSWSCCKFCGKKFHIGCIVSRDLYVNLETGEICCIDCEPSDTVPLPNSIGTMDRSTLVRNDQKTDQENVAVPRCKRSAPQRLARVDKGKKPISKGTTDKSTSAPLAIVPPTLATDDDEKVSEESTPSPSALEYKRKNSYTEARAKAQAFKGKHRMGRYNESYRYTPRMTDDELKEISKSANVKITPLFEKVLTYSDSGKIGRLVLPKKCAEDFFPPLDNPIGQPITIQDARGKDWQFHFRFWQNGRSRIYLIEGFKPFVKEMNLSRGDTVTFSRLDPIEKLVMGHRKGSTASPSNKRRKLGRYTATKRKTFSKRRRTSAARKGFKAGSKTKVPSTFVAKRDEMESDTDPEEVPLVTGYLENDTSNRRPIMGTVTKGVVIRDDSKGKAKSARPSMFGIAQASDEIGAPSGHKGKAKLVPISSKRKSCGIEIDTRRKSVENEKKNKRTKKAKMSPEPKPSSQVETTKVPQIKNVVIALPVPQNAIKKHPRHRPGCVCIVCTQPASGSKHKPSCECTSCVSRRGKKGSKTGHQKLPMGQPSNIPNPGDQPGSSQINYQATINEDHQNAKSLSALGSKILPFDLNDLPPESDEDF